jgi:hypothetical protein
VQRDDRDSLVEALGQLCCDAELRHQLGRANRRRVELRFRIAPMVDAFRHIVADIMGQG